LRQRLGSPTAASSQSSDSGVRGEEDTIHTAGAAALVDVSNEGLVREINRTLQIPAFAPATIALGMAVTLTVLIFFAVHHWAWLFAVVPAAAGTIWGGIAGHRRDMRVKTVHLWFDLQGDAGARFQGFEDALGMAASCHRVWRVTTREAISDWKRNAGAGSLVTRRAVFFTRKAPRYLDSNLRPYSLVCGAQTLYFFPNQVLVYEGTRVGAVAYDSLRIGVEYSEFRETDAVPGDADVVGHTWRYVNKKGGPDRRFNNNTQIPICRYETLVLSSPTGLNIHLMLSRAGGGRALREAEAGLIPLQRDVVDETPSAVDPDQQAFQEWIRARRQEGAP
jgi:hypothetical protein